MMALIGTIQLQRFPEPMKSLVIDLVYERYSSVMLSQARTLARNNYYAYRYPWLVKLAGCARPKYAHIGRTAFLVWLADSPEYTK